MMVKRFQSIRDCFNLIITSSLLHFIILYYHLLYYFRVVGRFLVDHSIGLSSDWMTNQALTIPLICIMHYHLSIYSFQPAIAFCYTLESFKPISVHNLIYLFVLQLCVFSLVLTRPSLCIMYVAYQAPELYCLNTVHIM